ncbi:MULTISPECIES: PucR family transcriptional regulator [unclassified Paenibacillus]|uniref:PucR family transcriptional regulator n=1 Tax=unclassified Paenibacillus TaxID=185978 RepID=UPI00114205C2|nr:PucR family transcriptional regulator [Paenibacillus sp. tmac-D7]
MNMTVEQALSVYPLSEGRLIAGRDGAARIVKSVNVMDAPDITEWIKDGEMLFTTAYVMKDRPEEAIDLLRKLHARGSAGLGIKLGRFWTNVPQSIVEEADRLGFPLIELPYQFTFSDQMNGLFHAELERNTRSLQRLLEKQKKLMQFALGAQSDSMFFEQVQAIVETPFAVVSSRGHLIYNATSYGDKQLLEGWPWREGVRRLRAGGGEMYRVPVEYKRECIGYAVFGRHEVALMKEEEGLFVQTAEILAHHLSCIYRDELERSLNRDLGGMFARYLSQDVPVGMLTAQMEDLGIRVLGGSYQCVLTKVMSGVDGAHREVIKAVREELEYNPAFRELEVVHFVVGNGVFSIFRGDEWAGSGKLPDIMNRALGCMLDKGILPQIRMSVSNKKTKPAVLRQAYMECSEAFELAERLGVADKVVRFESVELAYVFRHVPTNEMRTYGQEVLAELLAKDPDYAHEMLRTLEAFLEHDGQVNEAAKHLFVHRNTVAYRLEKIGEILGADFKKMNDLLRLKLAFMFRRMLDERDSE